MGVPALHDALGQKVSSKSHHGALERSVQPEFGNLTSVYLELEVASSAYGYLGCSFGWLDLGGLFHLISFLFSLK